MINYDKINMDIKEFNGYIKNKKIDLYKSYVWGIGSKGRLGIGCEKTYIQPIENTNLKNVFYINFIVMFYTS